MPNKPIENGIFVCPTCKDWKYLELYEKNTVCYCRRCEEGCKKPLIVPEP